MPGRKRKSLWKNPAVVAATIGATCLATIVRFPTENATISGEEIDKEIRKLPKMFSTPPDLAKYACRKGPKERKWKAVLTSH